MTTFEPAKRKHHPGAVRRFQAALFVWMLILLLISYHPPLWFLPPFTFLNPVLYLGILLLWMPFALFHIRRCGMSVLSALLVAGCAAAMVMGILDFVPDLLESHTWKWTIEQVAGTPFIKYSNQGCYPSIQSITTLAGFPAGIVTHYFRACLSPFIYILF